MKLRCLQVCVTLLLSAQPLAMPVMAQQLRRGLDLGDMGWAMEHAVVRCKAYQSGKSWGEAQYIADRELVNNATYRMARAELSAGAFEGALNTAAARLCTGPHRRAWESMSGEIAP